VPSKPDAPSTFFNGDTVQIDWVAPNAGGSDITGYRILILESDGFTYSLELDDCDGTYTQAIIDSQQCTVKVTNLRDEPFSLAWGSSVEVKVLAFNSYGDS
jgi:hypothetical protein